MAWCFGVLHGETQSILEILFWVGFDVGDLHFLMFHLCLVIHFHDSFRGCISNSSLSRKFVCVSFFQVGRNHTKNYRELISFAS